MTTQNETQNGALTLREKHAMQAKFYGFDSTDEYVEYLRNGQARKAKNEQRIRQAMTGHTFDRR